MTVEQQKQQLINNHKAKLESVGQEFLTLARRISEELGKIEQAFNQLEAQNKQEKPKEELNKKEVSK